MKKILLISVVLILIITLLISCAGATTQQTSTTAVSTTTTTTTTTTTNWWDKFGTPNYGGTILYGESTIYNTFDTFLYFYGVYDPYCEQPFTVDWTLDRSINSFRTPFISAEYYVGQLVETWEMTDGSTMVMQLRKGIHWQNKAPLNGRELTAYDLQAHYDRILGTGSGYTAPCPLYVGRTGSLQSVTAQDNYTAIAKFKASSALNFYALAEQGSYNHIMAPELVKPEQPLTDWKQVVGAGPWMLVDFVDGNSVTYDRNPDYWAYDERYPQNKLPYADQFKILVIPDTASRLAAIRTGKVQYLENISLNDVSLLTVTNREIQIAEMPYQGDGIAIRVDLEPFDNINVRKAMQMSINRELIAETYYGGTVNGTPCGWVHPSLSGWAFAYKDWSQQLKDEYSYNPSKATELLTQAGLSNGFECKIIANSSATANDLTLLQIIKSYLDEVNITMNIEVMDSATYQSVSRSFKGYDLRTVPNSGSTTDPVTILSMSTTKSANNYGRYSDPDYEALFLKLQAAASMDEAKNLSAQLDKITLEEHWGIRTFPINRYNVWRPSLKGYSGENMLRVSRMPFARCWIEE